MEVKAMIRPVLFPDSGIYLIIKIAFLILVVLVWLVALAPVAV
jgi:hypothetical protein